MVIDFGDILVIIIELFDLDLDGLIYNINFFNIGLFYVYVFENKVLVGVMLCGIVEFIFDVVVFGFVIDVGVQYVMGDQDNFKFGIVLCNVGFCMFFIGQGLVINVLVVDGDFYSLMLVQCFVGFELLFMLNIGVSYDFFIGGDGMYCLIVLGNFMVNLFFCD